MLPDGVTDNSQATKYKKRTTGLKNLEASNELFIKLGRRILHRRGYESDSGRRIQPLTVFQKVEWSVREYTGEGEKRLWNRVLIYRQTSPYRKLLPFLQRRTRELAV